MIAGIVISTAGGSMIWPFLLIYVSGKLNLPLSTVATLISINAGTGLFASFLAGTLADKIGRKVVMVFSLAMNGIAYFFLMRAETYPHFVILMLIIGFSNPLYQVGADAMLADMIPSEQTHRRIRHQPHRQQCSVWHWPSHRRISRIHIVQSRFLWRICRFYYLYSLLWFFFSRAKHSIKPSAK